MTSCGILRQSEIICLWLVFLLRNYCAQYFCCTMIAVVHEKTPIVTILVVHRKIICDDMIFITLLKSALVKVKYRLHYCDIRNGTCIVLYERRSNSIRSYRYCNIIIIQFVLS